MTLPSEGNKELQLDQKYARTMCRYLDPLALLQPLTPPSPFLERFLKEEEEAGTPDLFLRPSPRSAPPPHP